MVLGSYSLAVHPDVPPLLGRLLGEMHPAARDARVVRCWAGLLDFASLEVPMMGPLPAGDGTPVSRRLPRLRPDRPRPALRADHGLLLAELISGGEAQTLSLAPVDPARYVGVRYEPTWFPAFTGDLSLA